MPRSLCPMFIACLLFRVINAAGVVEVVVERYLVPVINNFVQRRVMQAELISRIKSH